MRTDTVNAIVNTVLHEGGRKSIGRRQTRAMLEWQNRWVVGFPPGYQNRRARRAEAVRVERLLKQGWQMRPRPAPEDT